MANNENQPDDINNTVHNHLGPSSSTVLENDPCSQQTSFICNETVDTPQNSDHLSNFPAEIFNFEKNVSIQAAQMVTKLYSNTSISRSVVNEILLDINQFYQTCIDEIKQMHTSINDDCQLVNAMLEITKNAFSPFSSEYQVLKILDDSSCLIKPVTVSIAAELKPRRVKKKIVNRVFNISLQYIPLQQVLTKFLELLNVYDTICKFVNSCENQSEKITSILQTESWKDIKKKYENKTVLPLSLYFDDYEVNNPLGTHRGKNKLGAVYYRLNCLPYEHISKLKNIFLAQIHNSKNHEGVSSFKPVQTYCIMNQ